MIEDKLLIWKFKLGDAEALRRIYEKYKNDMLKLAIALVGDISTAEDIVAEVFIAFGSSAEKIRLSGNLKSFLSTCIANKARNYKRDRQRHETSNINEAETIISELKRPEQWAILNEEMQLLGRAMKQIPYEQREVVTLYMHSGLTFRQIAEINNVSINTIQGRYRYGLNKLRSLLNGQVEK